jgi:peptidoglycan/LPS O-acetylase OafA/YrhL
MKQSSALPSRIGFLDSVRGILALTVTICHCLVWCGAAPAPQFANLAVDGFFILSGYVLAQSYDGRFVTLLARRFIRLWPVYALCLTIGYALNGMFPIWPELVWWPTDRFSHLDLTDKPVWTLYIEAWATPFLPVLVWLARTNRSAALLLAGILLSVAFDSKIVLYFGFFALGVAGAQYGIRFPANVPAWSRWLGKTAYSQYLTNWLVLIVFNRAFGVWGVIPALPAIVVTTLVVWWAVERPSILLSHKVTKGIARSSSLKKRTKKLLPV